MIAILVFAAIVVVALLIITATTLEIRSLNRAIKAIESGDLEAAYELAGRTNYRMIGSVR